MAIMKSNKKLIRKLGGRSIRFALVEHAVCVCFFSACACTGRGGGQFFSTALSCPGSAAVMTRSEQLLLILLCGFSLLYPHMAVIYILLTARFLFVHV